MAGETYFKVRDEFDLSWHVKAMPVGVSDRGWHSACEPQVARPTPVKVADHLPQGERSCESCFRALAKRAFEAQAADAERDPV